MLVSQKQTSAPSRRYALHGGFSFSYSLLLLYFFNNNRQKKCYNNKIVIRLSLLLVPYLVHCIFYSYLSTINNNNNITSPQQYCPLSLVLFGKE